MRSGGPAAESGLIVVILLASAFAFIAILPRTSSGFTLHPTILIDGNAGFTPANGVVGGTGTQVDPYTIEGWEIDTQSATGIEVRNTNVFFVVRNAYLHSSRTDYFGTDGVRLTNVTNGRVEGVEATNNAVGIVVAGSRSIGLAANNASLNRGGGVWIADSSNVTVSGNIISRNTGDGLLLGSATNVTLSQNTLTDNSITFWGLRPHYTSHTILPDNLVNGMPVIFRKNCGGVDLDAVPVGELIVANCTAVRLANLTLADSDAGMILAYVDGAHIEGASVSNSFDGIRVESSRNVTIANSSFSGGRAAAIRLSESTGLTVRQNLFSGGWGVVVSYGSNHAIVGNRCLATTYCIDVTQSNAVAIRGNIVTDGVYGGIQATFSSNVTVEDNSLSRIEATGVRISDSVNLIVANNSIAGTTWVFNGPGSGLYLTDSRNALVASNNLSDNRIGAIVHTSSNTTVVGNTAWNNTLSVQGGSAALVGNRVAKGGLALYAVAGSTVRGNTIVDGGLTVWDSVSVTATGNDFVRGGIQLTSGAISSPNVAYYNSHIIGEDNFVNGRPVRYVKDCSSVDVDGAAIGQLLVANCTGVRAANLNLANATVGVEFAFVDGGLVEGARLDDMDIGIRLDFTGNVTVRGNAMSRGRGSGVAVLAATNTSVTKNTLVSLSTGIYIAFSDAVTVRENKILAGGQPVAVLPLTTALRIDHNAFIDSTYLPRDYTGPENAWDDGYPSGGNYWSNYTGIDRCSGPAQDVCPDPDGIGDTPFVVDEDTRDLYPLMAPHDPNDTPPIASFAVNPATGDVLTVFSVDASASSDSEDPPGSLLVRWDWENDGVWDTGWTVQKTAQHRYDAPGVYTVRLEVRDSSRITNSTTARVTVTEHVDTPPVISIGLSPDSGDVQTMFAGAATTTDADQPSDSLEVRWDWEGDGAWDTAWSTAKTAQHRYGLPGSYTVRAEVRDQKGLTGSAIVVVVVRPGPGTPGSNPGSPPFDPVLPATLTAATVATLVAVLVLIRRRRTSLPAKENAQPGAPPAADGETTGPERPPPRG